MASNKRGPSVLVTDSRERSSRSSSRPSLPSTAGRPSMRLMTVDNVLQYASDVPSARPRIQSPVPNRSQSVSSPSLGGPPLATSRPPAGQSRHVRRPSGAGLAGLHSRMGQPKPSRTTKISEKLVLLPDAGGSNSSPEEEGDDGEGDEGDEGEDEPEDEELARADRDEERLGREERKVRKRMARIEKDEAGRPPRDSELDVLRKRGGIRGKSYAERLPKKQRTEKLSRVTAYCVAQAFKVKEAAEFLRKRHEAKTKLYDDCLYAVYALPLLPGTDGHRVRSRPILKTPGTGKTVLDLEIERSERRGDHEGLGDFDEYAVGGSPRQGMGMQENGNGHEREREREHEREMLEDELMRANPISRIAPEAKNFAEAFVYSYGVVVFWNFTEHQEKDILADLTFASTTPPTLAYSSPTTPSASPYNDLPSPPADETTPLVPHAPKIRATPSLMTRPLDQKDYETEEFHFEHSSEVERPRVFNDMITLLPRSDHMIKLTISHAIAQSTKLCFFEERMSETMESAKNIPKTLALTGKLNMTRVEIVKIMGRLFKNRVDINLSSNILDVPNFFWDSEPTLHPLYVAIREYLEIDPRIKAINERCKVFLDLAEILSDSVNDSKMSYITWVIILLICVSIFVTTMEVAIRFGMLRSKVGRAGDGEPTPGVVWWRGSGSGRGARVVPARPSGGLRVGLDVGLGGDGELRERLGVPENVSMEDLRRWARALVQEEGTLGPASV